MNGCDLIFELVTAASCLEQLSDGEASSLISRAIAFIKEIAPEDQSLLSAETQAEVISILTSPSTIASLPRDLIQIYLLDAAELIKEWMKMESTTAHLGIEQLTLH